MADGIYLSGAAMVSQQARQEALVNNIANSSTPGYKAAHVFVDVLREVSGDIRAAGRNERQYIDFSQGSLKPTGRDLDLALQGEGFFVVQTPDGERFTRDGNFTLDGGGTLVTQDGFPVAADGGPITLQNGPVEVTEDGEFLVNGLSVGKLLIRNFADPAALRREGSGLFGPRPDAPLHEIEPDAKVAQRSLEDSNVEEGSEMMRMMALIKQFEAAGHTLKLQSSTLRRVANELITG